MPVQSPAFRRGTRRFVPARFVIRVGEDWSPIRAAPIWPIADVLDASACLESPGSTGGVEPGLAIDLLDAGMLAPPRARRRERRVSSRAVFYQAADA